MEAGEAVIEALAGGGILAMVASTVMPEAFEQGGASVGLATIAGFLSAFLFTAMSLWARIPGRALISSSSSPHGFLSIPSFGGLILGRLVDVLSVALVLVGFGLSLGGAATHAPALSSAGAAGMLAALFAALFAMEASA
jgi:hypothetical protein